jgi:hypothetical protein
MTNTRDEGYALDDIWRERLSAAEELCNRARAEADAAIQLCGCDATDVQIEALFQTFAREAAALDEYMRVIQGLHELVVGSEKS